MSVSVHAEIYLEAVPYKDMKVSSMNRPQEKCMPPKNDAFAPQAG